MAKPLLYIVDDEPSISKLLEHWATATWGYEAKLFGQGETCLEQMNADVDIVLLDIMMPGIGGIETLRRIKAEYPETPVIILSAQADISVAVEAIRIGAYDYFTKPIDQQKLQTTIANALRVRELSRAVVRLNEAAGAAVHFENIISNDGRMQDVFKLVNKVKDSDITVLLQGESGTGKELIARAIHFNGRRNVGPFVTVNCASIPRELLESEMFGHERGSFTGAIARKIGKFEQASGGTIFLDEIGEMDMSLQAKVLRAIQTKQFERVGSNDEIKSDVRIISATNRDLKAAVEAKMFREDLFYRLASFPIHLPPLRERRHDILVLAENFLHRFAREQNKPVKSFSRKALRLLFEYPWPGNVRELENAVERAVILSETEELTEHELPLSVQASVSATPNGSKTRAYFDESDEIIPFDELKQRAIRQALRVTGGNIVESAKLLQIGRATLYRLMERYKIR